MKTVSIYALCDPITGIIRYIGVSKDPSRRLSAHWGDKKLSRKRNWIRSLPARPKLRILKVVSESEWPEWEMRYIRCARALGFDLVNTTEGGERGPDCTGRKATPEGCLAISRGLTGKKLSEEHRESLHKSHVGKPWSEARRKAGHRRSVPAWNKGIKLSEAHKAAIGVASKARWDKKKAGTK